MPNPAKEKAVAELNELFQKAQSVVLADYQGVTAPALAGLRRYMKERSLGFYVVKNTLAKQAAKNTPLEALDDDTYKGPISMVISFDDLVAPAKALTDYAKTGPDKEPEILCGVLSGKKISRAEVEALSKLPSREALLSQMLSVFQGPATQFVGTLQGVTQKFVGTLNAIKEQKEKTG